MFSEYFGPINIYILIVKIYNLQADLNDVSAEKTSLLMSAASNHTTIYSRVIWTVIYTWSPNSAKWPRWCTLWELLTSQLMERLLKTTMCHLGYRAPLWKCANLVVISASFFVEVRSNQLGIESTSQDVFTSWDLTSWDWLERTSTLLRTQWHPLLCILLFNNLLGTTDETRLNIII